MCLQSMESGAGWKTDYTKRAVSVSPSSWEQDTHALDGSMNFTQEQMNEKSPESGIAHHCISSFCEHLIGRRAENVQIRSYCMPPACCDLFVQDSKFLPTPKVAKKPRPLTYTLREAKNILLEIIKVFSNERISWGFFHDGCNFLSQRLELPKSFSTVIILDSIKSSILQARRAAKRRNGATWAGIQRQRQLRIHG